MNKDRKLVFGVLALLVGIIVISITYAGFTQNLNINGTANVVATSWNVHFANLVNGIRNGTANERTAPTIKSGNTTIGDYAVDFYTPGDSITYTFDVVNDGNYDAKIAILTKGTPTCSGSDSTSNTNVCANLEYTLKYTSNSQNVAVNDTLAVGETKNMTLVLRYKSTISQNDLPTAEVTVSGLGITIQYSQDSLAKDNTPSGGGSGSGSSSAITYVTRQNEGQITAGDEVAIDTEHFYVISSDSTNTVLLAKYNLLVGDVYNYSNNKYTWSFTKTLTSSDDGYGLQSESAKGYYSGCTDRTGAVAFSGKGYWDNAECVWNGSTSNSCPGTAGLKGGYANSSNAAGKTGTYSTPYPYVYNSTTSSIAPSYGTFTNSGSTWRAAQDNGYTIAYYVEGYVNALKGLGAPNNIEGRLLSDEEASSLSSAVKGDWSYWLGSAYGSSNVRYVSGGFISHSALWSCGSNGVRPVIVVSTSDI